MAKLFRELPLPFFALVLLTSCATAPEKPDPSVRVQMRAFERAVQGCGDADKSPHPCVSYRVTWPEITHAPHPGAAQRMNQTIQDALRPHPPSEDWAQEATLLEAAYKEFQDTRPDNEVTFYHRRVAEIIRSTHALISLSVTEDRFTGEGAPTFHQNFLNFDTKTGEIVRLSSLLAPGAAEQLRRYNAHPETTPFAPAPEGLFLATPPSLPPLLVPWSEAAALFPPNSPVLPAPER